MSDREAAARFSAIANLPIGWLLDAPRRLVHQVVVRATGPEGAELEGCGETPAEAWEAVAHELAAMGNGRLFLRCRLP